MVEDPILDGVPSTLSANRVTVQIVDDQIQITFTSHDGETTWGEALSEADSLHLARRLGARGVLEEEGE